MSASHAFVTVLLLLVSAPNPLRGEQTTASAQAARGEGSLAQDVTTTERLSRGATSALTRPRSTLADRIVAWVGDEAIVLSETEDALARYQANGDVPGGPVNEGNLRKALQLRIDETLLLKAARQANIEAPAEAADNRATAMIKQIEAERGGSAELDALLRTAGQTRETFRNKMREQLRRDWVVARAVGTRFTILDADVAKFEQERRAKGLPTERYHLSHIFFPVSPDALKERWDRVTAMAHEARLEAERRHDFGAVAAEWAKSHAADGVEAGPLGAMAKDELMPELAAAVAPLEAGRSTPPIRTAKGVHVLYLERKTTPRQILFAQRFEEERAKWVKELRNSSTIQVCEPLLGEKRQ